MKLNTEQLLTGAGLALGTVVLMPLVKRAAQPILGSGVVGATLAGTGVRQRLSFVREELEDFMAEVQFERLKQRLDKETGSGNR